LAAVTDDLGPTVFSCAAGGSKAFPCDTSTVANILDSGGEARYSWTLLPVWGISRSYKLPKTQEPPRMFAWNKPSCLRVSTNSARGGRKAEGGSLTSTWTDIIPNQRLGTEKGPMQAGTLSILITAANQPKSWAGWLW